jgi:acyl dehydratase
MVNSSPNVEIPLSDDDFQEETQKMTEQIYHEDITEGMSLPTLINRPTPRQLVMWAGAAGEFSEMHYDIDFAREKGFPGIIVHGMLMTAFLARLVTDWMGVGGTLKKLKTRNEQFLLVNEEIFCKGLVAKKYVIDDEHYVECDLVAEKSEGGHCVSATAVVTLPTRKGQAT